MMKKIVGISLFLLLCLFVLPTTPVKSAGCGESCYSNADCDDPCAHCHIVGGAIKGTCRRPPSPDITCDICGCENGVKTIACPNCNYECYDCVFKQNNSWTALGCIITSSPQEFIAWLLARAIGIAGGIAFLLMIFASFQIITSSGDPQKLQRGKELLTSAIAGLLLIIFSLFLLHLIGLRILQIPGMQ